MEHYRYSIDRIGLLIYSIFIMECLFISLQRSIVTLGVRLFLFKLKTDSMKYFFYLLTFTGLLTSCVSDGFNIGDNLVSSDARNILIDTCTVQLYTQLDDSTTTSGLGKIFVGRYESSDFGIIESDGYVSFETPSYSSSEFGSQATLKVKLDSITLRMSYDNVHYGDTTKVQTINLYKLKEKLELDENNSKLYTTSSFSAEETAFASHTFYRPNSNWENDSIFEMRLPDAFGEELIRMMKAQSDTLDSTTKFQQYFKGFKISPGKTDDATVSGFAVSTSSPVIRLYYHTYGVGPTEKTLDIAPVTTTAFSHVNNDRSATKLAPLTYKNRSIVSTETDNKAYIQGINSLYIKMNFPHINNLLQIGKFVNIASAYLYIYPAKNSYSTFIPLPKSLVLNYLDENGKALDIYVDSDKTAVQSGSLTQNPIYENGTYYAFDISSYITNELGAIGVNKTMLQLDLSDDDASGTFKSLVIGDSKNTDRQIKLLIYFVVNDDL